MNSKEYWIDFIKFGIQNDYKTRQESMLLTIVLIGSSFFVYNLIFSIYKFDLIVNIVCILIFIYVIISISGAILFVKNLPTISFKKAIGFLKHGYLFTFLLYVSILIITYFLIQKYFQLIVLVIPLFLTLTYGCFFILSYIDLFYRTAYKEALLYDIVNGKISDKQIYPTFKQIRDTSLKDLIFGVYKSTTQSQKSNELVANNQNI